MVTVDETFIKGQDFKNKLESLIDESDLSVLTPKEIRHSLEKHYELEPDSLRQDPWKNMITKMIDNYVLQKQTSETSAKEKLDNSAKRKRTEDLPAIADTEDEEIPQKKRAKRTKQVISSDDEGGDEKDESVDEKSDDMEEEEEKKVVKKKSKKATSSSTRKPGSAKDEETIKRLKGFINKCGVRKVWSKELAGCHSAKAEIEKLKAILRDLGVEGRPSIEKCEAIKRERELKKELESLDTSHILTEEENSGRRSRRRAASQPKSYKLDEPSDEEEEEKENENEKDAEESAEGSAEDNNEENDDDEDEEEESEDEYEEPSDNE